MRDHLRRWVRRGRAGQSSVELSLALPLLALLVVGSADAARATVGFITVANAAASGALYGSRGPSFAADTTGIQAVALAAAQDLGGTPPTVAIQLQTDSDGYQVVSVTVSYQMATAGWPGLPDPLELQKTVVMRVLP
ncbi:MAG: pilus assembly protein [Chloroflexi bacterium]|nr:pilus assembly protein [Chloroflexota bacterium]